MYDFSGKRIFITGGSRGIGKAIAQGYATYGAEIVITYKSKEKLAKELINSLPGQNHSCLELDVTNSEDIKNITIRCNVTTIHTNELLCILKI